jgi:integrase
MPRPRTPVGQFGDIGTKQQHPNGKWRAWASYRQRDGSSKLVNAYGKTQAAAKLAVKNKLANMTQTSRSGQPIRPTTTVSTLAKAWLDEKAGDVTAQTLDEYSKDIGRYICKKDIGIGDVQIQEVETSSIDDFLGQFRTEKTATARRLRTILTGMFGLAARRDAIAFNPVRETKAIRRNVNRDTDYGGIRAVNLDELYELRRRVELWQTGEKMPEDRQPRQKGGRKRAQWLLDFVDVLIGTGARPNEVLAVRWRDVDLASQPARVEINGTVVELPGKQSDGGGLFRQPWPKTASGWRVLKVPNFTRDTLLRLSVNAIPNPGDLVFPNERGGLRSLKNTNRAWRSARGEKFSWVTPKSFRKTVLTMIDREASLEDASAQAGHSGTAVTKTHYVQKAAEAPDNSKILDVFRDSGRANL